MTKLRHARRDAAGPSMVPVGDGESRRVATNLAPILKVFRYP